MRPTARLHKRIGVELTRKRKRDPSTWKTNVRKSLRQSGKAYVDSRGKLQPKRSLKTKKDCSKCKFHCSLNFSENDRCDIFREFWTLDDDEKLHCYAKTTQSAKAKRQGAVPSRKKNRISYCLPCNGETIRVCKVFYRTTLDISHRLVCTYHVSKHTMSGTPSRLKWGQNPISLNQQYAPFPLTPQALYTTRATPLQSLYLYCAPPYHSIPLLP